MSTPHWKTRTLPLAVGMFLGLTLAFSGWVRANPAEPIDLNQAIERALRVDTQVATAGNELEKSKLAVAQESIANLPSATLEGSGRQDLLSDQEQQNYRVQVQQTIPTGFHLYGQNLAGGKEAARWSQQSSESEYRIQRATVVCNTINYYLAVLKAERDLRSKAAALEYASRDAVYAKEQLALGKITKTTQLTAENSLAQARYNLEKSRQELRLARKKLANQIGAADPNALQLAEISGPGAAAEIPLEQAQQAALERRLELQKYRIALRQAEQDLATAKNEGLPSLNLSYQDRNEQQSNGVNYNFLDGDLTWLAAWQGENDSERVNQGSGPFEDQYVFGKSRRYLTLKLTWTLDFGSAASKVKQAEYTLDSAKQTLLQSSRDIALEVEQALSDYDLAASNLAMLKEAIPLQEKALELKRLELELGKASRLAVSKAELDLESARSEVEKAAYDLEIAAAKLKLATGELYQ
jgi:outer membrane protein TolC